MTSPNNTPAMRARYATQWFRVTITTAALLLFLPTACGYYNPNLSSRRNDPGPILLFAPVWENRTNELGLESVLHNAVQDWMLQAHRVKLATSRASATHLLEGSILAAHFPGISYDAADRARALRALLTVRYAITDTRTGETVLASDQHVLEEKYAIGLDALQTDANKKTALKIIADDLGEHIYFRTLQTITAPRPVPEPGP